MVTLQNQEELHQWLVEQGVDTSTWGHGESKTVAHLWRELESQDMALEGDPPLRLVDVVQVVIARGELVLVEAAQEFATGRRRRRNLPPSEKIRPGEDYRQAALRCLKEELGLEAEQVRFLPESYHRDRMVVESPSYPGLPTQYTFHIVAAAAASLPQTDFWHDNTAFAEGDPIRRHHWVWRPFKDAFD